MFFWMFTALFIAMALFFILPPLLSKPTDIEDDRRDQNIRIAKHQLAELEDEYKEGSLEEETYQATKKELEEALYKDLEDAEDTSKQATEQNRSILPLALVALFVPALSVGMYLKLGNPEAIPESSVVINNQAPANPQMSMEKAVKTLEDKLKEEPDNFTGWVMLGRSYMVMNKPAEAVKAYETAMALNPDEAVVMLQMADALGTAQGGNLTGKPEELILKALEKEPDNVMGLWLAGMSAKQRGDNARAIEFWNKVVPKLAADSEERKEVLQLIAESGGAAVAPASAPAQQSKPQPASTGSAITVTVNLADELKDIAQPGQTVFIYAKAVSGPPMPLAAVRKTVGELPIQLVLDDSQAMMPQLKISGFQEVTVGARISVSGTPTKSPGDLFTEVSPVKLGQTVNLNINSVAQ